MTRRTKRVLIGIGVAVVVIVGTPIAALMITWAGDASLQDGAALGDHATQVKDGIVSIGVVDVGGGDLVLVDCGNDKDAKAIEAELQRRKLTDDAVKGIFITHGHPDHVAACNRFKKAERYAMADEVDMLEGRAKSHGPLTGLFPAKDTGVRVTHPLADGEKVTVGDAVVEAFALPGHTRGSAAYLIDGVLYFGDGASGSKDGKVTPPKYLFSDDQKQGIASLKALEKRLEPRADDIKVLEFAHTGALAGFAPLRAFAQAN